MPQLNNFFLCKLKTNLNLQKQLIKQNKLYSIVNKIIFNLFFKRIHWH